MKFLIERQYFWIGIAVILTLASDSPAVALVIGAAISLIWGNPMQKFTGGLSKKLLQLSVILLGFGLSLGIILKVGYTSIGVTFVSITSTLIVGYFLAKLFKVERNLGILVSSGTAICGGSAIAAMAPAIGASQAHTAIAMAVVFLLNGLALIIFPHVGHLLNMSQVDFGVWSALAIHDTSSVVGAAAIFGAQALAVGTTVKLTRALWILPLSFVGAKLNNAKDKPKVQWFIFGFILAAVIRTYLPHFNVFWGDLAMAGKKMMVATLFLVGSGLTRNELKKIGVGPMVMAVCLWAVVSVTSLAAITHGLVHLNIKF